MSTAKQISRASGSAGEPARESERRSESARLVGGGIDSHARELSSGDGDARTVARILALRPCTDLHVVYTYVLTPGDRILKFDIMT